MTNDNLQVLQDRLAITDRIHQYARAMDRMDNELGYDVFLPEAEADYGEMFQGTGYGFVDFAYASHQRMLRHQHTVSNITIRIDGDRASSEAYVIATFRFTGEDGALLGMRSQGRYLDRWQRQEGIWRIAHRQYIHEMDETWPAQAEYEPRGRRDRQDPSYEVLG